MMRCGAGWGRALRVAADGMACKRPGVQIPSAPPAGTPSPLSLSAPRSRSRRRLPEICQKLADRARYNTLSADRFGPLALYDAHSLVELTDGVTPRTRTTHEPTGGSI